MSAPCMTTAQAVVESLIRHGIDTLYALPGVHNDHRFDAAQRTEGRFRVLYPRYEQTSALHGARRRIGDRAAASVRHRPWAGAIERLGGVAIAN